MRRPQKSHLRSLLNVEFFGDSGVSVFRAPAPDTLTLLIDSDCLEHFAEREDLHAARFNYCDKGAAVSRERVLRDYIGNHELAGIHSLQRGCTLFFVKSEEAYHG